MIVSTSTSKRSSASASVTSSTPTSASASPYRIRMSSFLAALALLPPSIALVESKCVKYSGSLCSAFVSAGQNVYIPDNGAFPDVASIEKNLVTEAGAISTLPCKSTCQNAVNSCSALFGSLGMKSKLPNCDGNVLDFGLPYPAAQPCLPLGGSTSTSPQNTSSEIKCPPPLLPNPRLPNADVSRQSCTGDCCLACPTLNNFYPEGAIDRYLNFTDAFRAVSAIGAFFVFLSFLVLPGKRNHPASIILWFSLSIFLFSSTVFFAGAGPNRRRIQCADPITQATQKNNMLCGVQGALLIFACHALCYWCSFLIANLHLVTVWNRNLFNDAKYPYVHLFCWGAPLTFTTTALALGAVQYEFGSLCLISSEWANQLFFYPLTGTVLYFTQINPMKSVDLNTPFIIEWGLCILQGKSQNDCSSITQPHVPNYYYMAIGGDFLPSIAGIFIFMIFGARISLLHEWRGWIYAGMEKRRRGGSSGSDEEDEGVGRSGGKKIPLNERHITIGKQQQQQFQKPPSPDSPPHSPNRSLVENPTPLGVSPGYDSYQGGAAGGGRFERPNAQSTSYFPSSSELAERTVYPPSAMVNGGSGRGREPFPSPALSNVSAWQQQQQQPFPSPGLSQVSNTSRHHHQQQQQQQQPFPSPALSNGSGNQRQPFPSPTSGSSGRRPLAVDTHAGVVAPVATAKSPLASPRIATEPRRQATQQPQQQQHGWGNPAPPVVSPTSGGMRKATFHSAQPVKPVLGVVEAGRVRSKSAGTGRDVNAGMGVSVGQVGRERGDERRREDRRDREKNHGGWRVEG
ncbi:Frizzled-3 [Phlyctochytrium planicorne]|nr:Frizzled-3 [Phlyctochytrium planicorne]